MIMLSTSTTCQTRRYSCLVKMRIFVPAWFVTAPCRAKQLSVRAPCAGTISYNKLAASAHLRHGDQIVAVRVRARGLVLTPCNFDCCHVLRAQLLHDMDSKLPGASLCACAIHIKIGDNDHSMPARLP